MIASLIIGLSSCKSILKSRELHPGFDSKAYDLRGKKALIVSTSNGVLNKPGETTGDSSGVFGVGNDRSLL